MRVSARPTIASFRQIISRRFASTEAQNPQVKAAVESANKAYDNALGSAKRVAGPIGEKVGSMLGGEPDGSGPGGRGSAWDPPCCIRLRPPTSTPIFDHLHTSLTHRPTP